MNMDKYNHELEWYIDYFDFIRMMKHEGNAMFTIYENYMIMQSIKVCMKYILDLKSSSGNKGGYRVQESDSELTGLLFQKKRQTPQPAIRMADIESASVR